MTIYMHFFTKTAAGIHIINGISQYLYVFRTEFDPKNTYNYRQNCRFICNCCFRLLSAFLRIKNKPDLIHLYFLPAYADPQSVTKKAAGHQIDQLLSQPFPMRCKASGGRLSCTGPQRPGDVGYGPTVVERRRSGA